VSSVARTDACVSLAGSAMGSEAGVAVSSERVNEFEKVVDGV
jgi:hypothetical protein